MVCRIQTAAEARAPLLREATGKFISVSRRRESRSDDGGATLMEARSALAAAVACASVMLGSVAWVAIAASSALPGLAGLGALALAAWCRPLA